MSPLSETDIPPAPPLPGTPREPATSLPGAARPDSVRTSERSAPEPQYTTVIEAGATVRQYWSDLYRYRELFLFLARRDLVVRYRQTVIGAAWAVIRPLATMIVLSVVFGRLAGMPSGNVPYPILVFAGILPWQFFAAALGDATMSLVANASLISKVYFPRLILPASAVIVAFVDFLVAAALLSGVFLLYRYVPPIQILTLPLLSLWMGIVALGPGLLATALNVRYRDFRYVVPFVVQFGLYVSPVGFRTDVVPEPWRLLYALNPVVGVIDAFRWAICGDPLDLRTFVVSSAVSLALLAAGVTYFRKTERTFADVI